MLPPVVRKQFGLDFWHVRRRRFRWFHLRWEWGQYLWDERGEGWYWAWDR